MIYVINMISLFRVHFFYSIQYHAYPINHFVK